MKRKIAALFTAIAVVICLLCACAEDGDSSGAGNYNVPDYQAAGEVKDGRTNIYLIVKDVNNNYFKVMIEAAKDAAKELDCNIYYSGSEFSSEWEAQRELMNIAQEKGADAVILAPDDSVKLAEKVGDLFANGIAVICVDAVISSDNYNVCYMTNNLSAGRQAAEEMLTHLRNSGISEGKEAKIAIQIGRSNSQTVNERVAGFCEYWAEHAPKKWEIIGDIKSNEGDANKALPIAEEFFKEYDNIKGVFGSNLVATRGFAKYVLQNNRRDVAVVGFDSCDELMTLINDGSYMASAMLQKQYDMAYCAIKAAIAIKMGKFSPDSKLVDTGIMAVNHGNLDDPDVKAALERN